MRDVLRAAAGHLISLLEDIPGGPETNSQAAWDDHTATTGAPGHPQARQEKVTFYLGLSLSDTHPNLSSRSAKQVRKQARLPWQE